MKLVLITVTGSTLYV